MENQVYEIGSMVEGLRRTLPLAEIIYFKDLVDKLVSMGSENLYNVTHMSDLDGISSAALLFKFFSMPLEHVYFTDYKLDTIKGVSESIDSLNLKGAAIIISDFSSNKANTEAMKEFLSRQKSKGNMLIWLDHHPWLEDSLASMSQLLDFGIAGENSAYCATEIIYKVLCENADTDGTGRKIAETAHIADFNLAPPPPLGDTSPNTGLAINYYAHIDKEKLNEGLRGLVKDVADLKYESSRFANATALYRKMAEAEFEKLKKGMKQIDAYGIKTVIGFGRLMHATSTCSMLHELTGADLVIYIRVDEKAVSLRSWGDVDCSKIAFNMRGGGHPHAAAFRIDDYGDLSTKEAQDKFVGMISPMIALSVGAGNDSA
ncbi:MAG: DHHA1 domain-containing protein [Candidatus Micrarchaeaceae archaeon]